MGYSGVRALLEASKVAGSTDTEKVIAAMEALKYDYYKGPQYFRKCDHQSVQSVIMIQSKTKDQKNESDVFSVLATEEPNEANLRTCAELGHKA
jgi:branched-chain amino acid transport system substrate-binding protein